MTFSVKPTFIGWTTLVAQLPLQLFFTVWMGGFFGGLTRPFLGSGSFFFFGAVAFFGIPLIVYFGKKLNYARTEYRFYEDRLEFEEGFLTINKKVIKYKDMKEVTLRRGHSNEFMGWEPCISRRRLRAPRSKTISLTASGSAIFPPAG
jgi:membrane protein YdbS with pleckstrin-like domain